jgi:hypothetical protein
MLNDPHDAVLPRVAEKVLDSGGLDVGQRNIVQDARWAMRDDPEADTA